MWKILEGELSFPLTFALFPLFFLKVQSVRIMQFFLGGKGYQLEIVIFYLYQHDCANYVNSNNDFPCNWLFRRIYDNECICTMQLGCNALYPRADGRRNLSGEERPRGPGEIDPRFFSFKPAFVERDSRRLIAGFSRSSISWGTCTLSRRVYLRTDGPRRPRSVYTVKPEAYDRIAGYIRCYEVGRVLHIRDVGTRYTHRRVEKCCLLFAAR